MTARHRFQTVFVVVACVLGGAVNALAAVSYSYVANIASNTSTTFNATINSSLTLNIYLQENLANSSSLLVSEGGLYSAGFTISLTGGSGATISNVTNAATLPQVVSKNVTNTAARLVENVYSSPAGAAATADSGGYEILLGTVTIATGSTALVATTFTIDKDTAIHETNQTFTNKQGYILDVTSTVPAYTGAAPTNASTFYVTTITPEPNSAVFCAIVCAGVLTFRRPPRFYRRSLRELAPVAART